ncbi:HAD-like domain-containing protein [Rhexocercosporidium sp. MPI-PUGE-AT-0058]|nr:HAD-like domain-containing protein [Rhexocercosporidium sp. MPI-PUGE-AT-0058]
MGKVRDDDPAQLTDFKLLSFDVYSTLIDEQGGMFTALQPLLSKLADPKPYTKNRARTLKEFQAFERKLQRSNPALLYPEVLAQAYVLFAESLELPVPGDEEVEKFSHQIPSWPSFPDTVPALLSLAKHYKLVILSNIDNTNIARTISGPLKGAKFDAAYTAQEIGSYKPDLRNFEYLLKRVENELGVGKEGVLHTAQSLSCDCVPAKTMGMSSVWIDRDGQDEKLESLREGVNFTWRFETLGEMAEAVEKAFKEKASAA